MFLPAESQMFSRFSFHYLIPHRDSDMADASPFQLISPGLLESVGAIHAAARLPRDAIELTMERTDIIGHRMLGRGLYVLPIQLSNLKEAIAFLSQRLLVVFSHSEAISERVTAHIAAAQRPILHVLPGDSPPSRSKLWDFAAAVASHWESDSESRPEGLLLQRMLGRQCTQLPAARSPVHNWNHNLVHPNLAVLSALEIEFEDWDGTPLVSGSNDAYLAAIMDSVTAVDDVRASAVKEHPWVGQLGHTDLILTAPAVIKSWHNITPDDLPEGGRRDLYAATLRELTRRRDYCMRLPEEVLTHIEADPVLKGMIAASSQDLNAYTAALSVRAASSVVPVIRLPMSVNESRLALHQFSESARGRSPTAHKLSRLARVISSQLADGLPDQVINAVKRAESIKLVSDAPLEWMAIDGMPLMLRCDVSRIPVTPGNAFVQNMLRVREVALPYEAFQDVLVLRSFRPGDPLKPLTEMAINEFRVLGGPMPRIEIVDVATKKDLVSALKRSSAPVVVYDGHGIHDRSADVGYLALEKERVDPWELRGEIEIPPVVILSACETHPFDSSHATVANGLLMGGALTVLSTSIPIGGAGGALLVARLMLRIGQYLPLLVEKRPWRSFRWSEILPGLQRRQYTTEVLNHIRGPKGARLSEDDQTAIAREVGPAIEKRGDWHGLLVSQIAAKFGIESSPVLESLRKQAYFVEALAYTQLGNPEFLIGYDEEAAIRASKGESPGAPSRMPGNAPSADNA